jgi:hypothetical protein
LGFAELVIDEVVAAVLVFLAAVVAVPVVVAVGLRLAAARVGPYKFTG